jgi:hypothetical protein
MFGVSFYGRAPRQPLEACNDEPSIGMGAVGKKGHMVSPLFTSTTHIQYTGSATCL